MAARCTGDVPQQPPTMRAPAFTASWVYLPINSGVPVYTASVPAKYGTPQCGPPPREAGFAVIGYGKLGGLELGYGSDLDLVFLHDSSGAEQETNGTPPVDNERFFKLYVDLLTRPTRVR